MRRYPKDATNIDWSKFKFVKFKIVVPTKQDASELKQAFEYIHNIQELDTDYVAVNQLAHQYLDDGGCNIIVDKKQYEELTNEQ